MTNTDPEVVYCDECWQPINDEHFYVMGFGKGFAASDEIICEKCMEEHHKVYMADYLEQRKDQWRDELPSV